ncbi:MAG: hypothetical protein IPO27_02220 [Bacteroidetes bacterium]|nr:hypothetical protein [Bacteroidota bacterium]
MIEKKIENSVLRINSIELSKEELALFTPAFESLLVVLHEELNEERKRLLSERFFMHKALETGHVKRLVDTHAEVEGKWQMPDDVRANVRKAELCCAADNDVLMRRLLQQPLSKAQGLNIVVDFEDSLKHTWKHLLAGMRMIQTVIVPRYMNGNERLAYKAPGISFRIRSMAAIEENVTINNEPVCAGLFDLAMSFCLANKMMLQIQVEYYIPKIEHYQEARWWNMIITLLENFNEIADNAIKTIFIIETLPASYQIEAILYETRNRTIALSCGYRNRITSDLNIVKRKPDFILPERLHLDLKNNYLSDFANYIIAVCHKHKALAIGGLTLNASGMTEDGNDEFVTKNNNDIQQQHTLGFDGCWTAHYAHIPFILKTFTETHQLEKIPLGYDDIPDLLNINLFPVTMEGLCDHVRTIITFLQAYNEGYASLIVNNRLEDVATYEYAKTQVIDWYKKGITLDSGEKLNSRLVKDIIIQESEKLQELLAREFEGNPTGELGAIINTYTQAAINFEQMVINSVSEDMLYTKQNVE